MGVIVPPKRSLTQRLKDATKGSGVNMMPEPKPAKEVEVIPDLRSLTSRSALRNRILKLSQQIYEWGVAEREAAKQKKPLVEELKGLLTEAGIDAEKFMVDDLRVLLYEVPRSSISMEELLKHGVAPKVIRACTVTSRSKALKVSMVGEETTDD